MLTVGQLKKALIGLPENLPCGVSGYFGEFNAMYFPPKRKIIKTKVFGEGRKIDALILDHVDIGEEPD